MEEIQYMSVGGVRERAKTLNPGESFTARLDVSAVTDAELRYLVETVRYPSYGTHGCCTCPIHRSSPEHHTITVTRVV